MKTNSKENLHKRAAALTAMAAKVIHAKSHLSIARQHEDTARADLSILNDLNSANDALDRVIKRAELQRQRLLRKADRQGSTP